MNVRYWLIILPLALMLAACSRSAIAAAPQSAPIQPPQGEQLPPPQQPSGVQSGEAAPQDAPVPTAQPTAHDHTDGTHSHDDIDLRRLPVGDGRLSTSAQQGYLWACQTNFMAGQARTGDWFNGDGTYDYTSKITVDGAVTWPSEFEIVLSGSSHLIVGNNLPDHPTGVWPIQAGDDAYQSGGGGGSIEARRIEMSLPANPAVAAQPSCIGMGPVGVMMSGAYLFNALNAQGLDAVAHESMDNCEGHPDPNGGYHYHSFSECIGDGGTGHSQLIGYVFDGFGIYGPRGEDGSLLTNADLDACHGHTHIIEWDGQQVEMYHYHMTYEYPYTVGCYMGTASGMGAGRRP